ncbi:MAG: cob(I)yrinic acid a,c-diamide adenosyltransferase [archaeon]
MDPSPDGKGNRNEREEEEKEAEKGPARLPEQIRELDYKILRERSRLGLVQVYTGNGKGKTTASLGLALRAAGYCYKTAIVQFLKIGYTGEALAIRKLGENVPIRLVSYGKKCVNQAQHDRDFSAGKLESYCKSCFSLDMEADGKFCRAALEEGARLAKSGEADVVILDEVNVAVSFGLISVESVLAAMKGKHPKTELILTGRNARQEIIDAADVVNEVSFLKNPYDQGIFARKGIEF